MVAGALALVFASCTASADPAEAQTRTVSVDAAPRTGVGPFSNPTIRGSFLAYFPSTLTVRPGDTVRFERVETGEPHSVTFGRALESTALNGIRGGFERIPQNLAQPCFLTTGAPPSNPRTPCRQVRQPRFDGTHSWYSSGFIPADRPFEVEIANDTKPGTYRFACVFHGDRMSGEIVVANAGSIPSQGEVDSSAAKQMAAMAGSAKQRVVRELERFEDDDPFPFPAVAGLVLNDGAVRVNEFLPFTIRAEVGEPVSWRVAGTHAISFAPPENARPPAVQKLLAGTVIYKENSYKVRRSADPPEDPPSEPTTIVAEPYDEGTQSSGILRSPNGLLTYTISFTGPGTKRYTCLIHPGMQGIVTVVL